MPKRGSGQVQCTCAICGKHFLAWPFELRDGNGKYRSRACYYESRRTRITCATCGTVFVRSRMQSGGHYCSRACHHLGRVRFDPERFWSHDDRRGGCWIWRGYRAHDRTSTIRIGTERSALQVAWALVRGPLPAGFKLRRICGTEGRIRPDPQHVRSLLD